VHGDAGVVISCQKSNYQFLPDHFKYYSYITVFSLMPVAARDDGNLAIGKNEYPMP